MLSVPRSEPCVGVEEFGRNAATAVLHLPSRYGEGMGSIPEQPFLTHEISSSDEQGTSASLPSCHRGQGPRVSRPNSSQTGSSGKFSVTY